MTLKKKSTKSKDLKKPSDKIATLFSDELSKASKKKVQILTGSLDAILAHGIDKLTYQLVADTAGVLPSHIAYYFPNKQKLIEDSYKFLIYGYQSEYAKHIKSTKTKDMLSEYIDVALDDPNRSKKISLSYLFIYYAYLNDNIRIIHKNAYTAALERLSYMLEPELKKRGFSKNQILMRSRSILGTLGETVRFLATTEVKKSISVIKKELKHEIFSIVEMP